MPGLAFKLTGWRIDIKDPESLRDQDLDFLRQAREALAGAPKTSPGRVASRDWCAPMARSASARRSSARWRLDLVGMSVDVEVRGEALEVYYNRDLRARFDFETGAELAARRDAGGEGSLAAASSSD